MELSITIIILKRGRNLRKNMEENVAIETVTVFPHTQFYFKYQLNEGVYHTIKKEQAFKYLSQFVELRNFLLLQDLLQRFLPFTIIVAQDTIIELKKKISDSKYYEKEIKKDIINQMKKPIQIDRRKPEHMPNDRILNDLYKKLQNKV